MKQLCIQLVSPVWQGKYEPDIGYPALGWESVMWRQRHLILINTNVFKEQTFPTFVLLPYLNLDALSIDSLKEHSGCVVDYSLQSLFLPGVVCRGGAPNFSEEHGCRTGGNSRKLQQGKLWPVLGKKKEFCKVDWALAQIIQRGWEISTAGYAQNTERQGPVHAELLLIWASFAPDDLRDPVQLQLLLDSVDPRLR